MSANTLPEMISKLTRHLLLTAAVMGSTVMLAQTNNIGINATGAAPAPSAMLDVSSTQRGFLIPRMTQAQRLAIAGGTPQFGLTVYQTNDVTGQPRGFWIYTTAWTHLFGGNQAWGLTGNAGTVPATNYLGTTDNQPVIMRASNVEGMRVANTGQVGIGTTTPNEALTIAGAIKLTGTSATNDAGNIRWNAAGYHQGNRTGLATGWRKLENDYLEVLGAAYTQAGTVTCAAGSVQIGANTNANNTNGNVTPYVNTVNRQRHQYLFLASEMNLTLNQLFNDPNATQGLCPGQPINSIGVYVASGAVSSTSFHTVRIKHSTVNTLVGFDNSVDPNAQCFTGGPTPFPNASPGWNVYTFGSPFIWDGTSNIIVEFCSTRGAAGFIHGVWSTTGLSFNGTFARYGTNGTATCNAVDGQCGGAVQGCGIATTGCSAGGATNQRPVIQWNGIVGTAPPATAANGDYVNYNGGFLVDDVPAGWHSNTVPWYAFKGPGTISAENGVYDDQTQLNDHVFDAYFDGRVNASDVDAFGDRRFVPVKEMVNYVEMNRHLPTMKGRAEWDAHGGFALGDLTNQLWATAETQALYLTELNDRKEALELLASDGPLSDQQFKLVSTAIGSMADLTDAQKEELIARSAERIQSERR